MSDRVEGDVHCLSCGYNLRTRRHDEACPECGVAVRQTIDTALTGADARWIARLRAGLAWLLIGAAAMTAHHSFWMLIHHDGWMWLVRALPVPFMLGPVIMAGWVGRRFRLRAAWVALAVIVLFYLANGATRDVWQLPHKHWRDFFVGEMPLFILTVGFVLVFSRRNVYRLPRKQVYARCTAWAALAALWIAPVWSLLITLRWAPLRAPNELQWAGRFCTAAFVCMLMWRGRELTARLWTPGLARRCTAAGAGVAVCVALTFVLQNLFAHAMHAGWLTPPMALYRFVQNVLVPLIQSAKLGFIVWAMQIAWQLLRELGAVQRDEDVN